jgi:hypothetical protein
MIKIDFAFESQYGAYRDALVLEDDHGLTAEQIEAMKQERFDRWISIIEAPPVEVPPNPDLVPVEEQQPAQE